MDDDRQIDLARQDAEDAYIAAWRETAGRQQVKQEAKTALALSGGGIRSAAYCLGVLQALAKHGVLERFDYLSTVSGGGYIGASLTWFTSEYFATKYPGTFGCSQDRVPFGIDDPDMAPRMPKRGVGDEILRHLRRYGNYLLPGKGIDLGSGIGVILRGILINLLVWVPLITSTAVICFILQHALGELTGLQRLQGYGLLLGAPAGIFGLLCVGYSVLTWTRPARRKPEQQDERGIPYLRRRCFETFVSKYLFLYAMLAAASSLMLLVHWFPSVKSLSISGISGAAGAIWGIASRFMPAGKSSNLAITFSPLAAVLLLYGVFFGCFLAGWHLYSPTPDILGYSLHKSAHIAVWPCIIGVIVAVLSLALGWFCDLNYISLHRYYRDRIMEAFMPDVTIGPGGAAVSSVARNANEGYLKDMCKPVAAEAPYHLINCTLVVTKITKSSVAKAALTNGRAEILRLRGGDNFLLSPRYCGCKTLGLCKTEEFMNGSLTLATAAAISGAAVNPSAAANGIGPTRSRSFAALMSLLNIRLGFWVANPRRKNANAALANHFNAGWQSFFDRLRPDAEFVELTDGGNFENLGVYELIRRQVHTIVVCDAGEDSRYAFADLQNLLSRAEADFRAVIRFAPPPLGAIMPSDVLPNAYPAAVKMSQAPFVVGQIFYAPETPQHPPVPPGTIYYLKPAIFAALQLSVLGYKSANPDFPDDSTADQFFSQAQFEAYRALGFASVEQMMHVGKIASQLQRM